MIKTKSHVGICSPPATIVPGLRLLKHRRGRHHPTIAVFEHDRELLRLLRPPRLRTLDDGERHACYLELFFDLVLVVFKLSTAQRAVATSARSAAVPAAEM